MDSAFGSIQRPYLIKLSQDDLFLDLPTDEERDVEVQRRRQATYGNETSSMVVGSLKDRFIYEDRGEWRIALKCFVLLHNLRSRLVYARLVGINQIRNVYMPHCWNAVQQQMH